jgi:hypothetical protein
MNATTSLLTDRESGATDNSHPLRQSLCWTLAGFSVGVVSASAYLLLGGQYFWDVPRWAFIAFRPGFFVGYAAYDWVLSQETSKVVGVLAVGLAYAAPAVLARFEWFALKLRLQSAALTQDPE